MPIPKPRKGESQDKFMNRCMSAMHGEFPEQKQRVAVCMSSWREMHGGKKPNKKTEKKAKE